MMSSDSNATGSTPKVIWLGALLVLSVGVLVGWRLLGSEIDRAAARPSQSESLTPTQKVLQRVGLQNSDLRSGEAALLAAKGNKLVAPSLSFCTGDFPSESRRLIRRLTQSWSESEGAGRVSTDVVQYESVEAAAEALEEVRIELAVCSADRIPAEVEELESTGKALLPGALSATLSKLTDSGLTRSANLWQVRGNMLVILTLQLPSATDSNSDSLEEFWGIGEALAQRLSELDEVEVGYF